MFDKKQKIEHFLQSLGEVSGLFYIVCGKCGVHDKLNSDGTQNDIEQEITGVYSDYTGHLWDEAHIKCKHCGNCISFTK
jgi:hypothetical protein